MRPPFHSVSRTAPRDRPALPHAGLVAAVGAVREAVQARGGELVVRQGPLAQTLLELAGEVGCSRVVAEVEVEYRSDLPRGSHQVF